MIRNAGGAFAAVLLVACTPSEFPVAADIDGGTRRPDGVAIDPALELPDPRHRGGSDQGLLTLRAPLGPDVALGTVAALFKRIVREDVESLGPLFTREVHVVNGSGTSAQQTSAAAAWWEPRFKKLDYGRLAGELIYRESDVELYRGDDELIQAPAAVLRTADTLEETDVVVRVPILTPRVGADRLLGDEMILWLRRDGDRYKIYRVVEDFQLP
jgi:hypothetical protein